MILANRTLTFSTLLCTLLVVCFLTKFNPFLFWFRRFSRVGSQPVDFQDEVFPDLMLPRNFTQFLPGPSHRNYRQLLYSFALKHHQNHLHRSPFKYHFNKVSTPYKNHAQRDYLRVCYYSVSYGDWPSLKPDSIEMNLCSHIIVGFARVFEGLVSPILPDDEALYKQVIALKERDPTLRVMLSVGGAYNDKGFAEMTSTLASREKFAVDSAKYLKKLNFDGLDLDWEFPAWNTPFEERFNFARLLQELHMVYKNPVYNLTLSVAVAAAKSIMNRSYRVAEMAKHVDFINLMGYDYHSFKWYLPLTGHNSPLYRRPGELSMFSTSNLNWSANYWVQLGMPREKIVVGVPTYGQTFRLYDEKLNEVYAPAVGTGDLGTDGQIPYFGVCQFLQSGAKSFFDKASQVPYALSGKDWISYDDEESLETKAKWVRENGFGGVMIYDLNCDDYIAACGNSTFPLIKSILKGLNYR